MRMPDTLGLPEEEEEAFLILRAFARNEPVELSQFTTTFVKSSANATVIPERFRKEMMLRMEHQNSTARLFGTSIRIGPSRIQLDRAKVVQLAATMRKFREAPMGAGVTIRLRPLVPVRFELVNRSALLPSAV